MEEWIESWTMDQKREYSDIPYMPEDPDLPKPGGGMDIPILNEFVR